MSTDTDDRAAAIRALTASLNAGVVEDETAARAAQLHFPGPWDRAVAPDSPLPSAVSLYDSRDESFGVIRGSYAADHIARHDPARTLRDVRAGRDLLAAVLAEPHDWVAGGEFYSCSQAVDPDEDDPGEKYPGSGCSDPDRAGQPCDCGRDARVERLLRILAGAYEGGKR